MASAKKPATKKPPRSSPLADALAALDAGDDLSAITAIARAWSDRRSPRLADFVDLIDARLPERPFAELLASKAETTARRLAAASPDDPRLSSVLLDLMEHPRFLTDRTFWDLVLDRVEACADPRLHAAGTRAPNAAIRSTLLARLSPVATRDHVVRRLDAIAMALPAPRKSTATETTLEDQIASRLAGNRERRDAEERILREIHDDPLADAPRLVYADLLSERGDPRGELIALQFERRDKGLDESKKARERWLLKQHMKEWLGGLAPAVANTQSYSATTFERGFVAIADIYNSAEKQLPLTWNEAGWATVEELRGPYTRRILEHAPLRGLRRAAGIGGYELGVIARMPEKFRHLSEIEISAGEPRDARTDQQIAECAGLPALRTLSVQFWHVLRLEDILWLANDAPVAARIERLIVLSIVSASPEADRGIHAGLLDALVGARGKVPSLGLVPPWRTWPRPPPVDLARQADGTYRRV